MKINLESIVKEATAEIIKSMIQAQLPARQTRRTRSVKAGPATRKLSPAGRAAIRRAVKARWAKFHAQQRKTAKGK